MSRSTEAVVAKQRKIQSEQDARDAQSQRRRPTSRQERRAGRPARVPGRSTRRSTWASRAIEADLELKPQFEAPDYRGSGKLQGMAALITGGDSGIGRAVAVLFAREGADVAIVYLSEARGRARDQPLGRGRRPRCLLIAGDVKDPAFCKQAVDETVRKFGRLDVLVNNAAFQEHARVARGHRPTSASTRRCAPTSYGYFHMARAALPHLKRGAAIINTGSVTGLEGSAHLLDYATTKGAIHAFTKSLAQQPDRPGHPRQRGRAGPGVDAAEPGRQAGREGRRVRQEHRHEARRAARGAVAGLRVPGGAVRARATSPASCCR